MAIMGLRISMDMSECERVVREVQGYPGVTRVIRRVQPWRVVCLQIEDLYGQCVRGVKSIIRVIMNQQHFDHI